MSDHRPESCGLFGPSPRRVVATHLAVVAVGWLALLLAPWVAGRVLGALASGLSWFALAGLLREAVHHRLAHRRGVNEALGMTLGWPLLLPLSAFRVFEAQHHRATNRPADPRRPLNRRVMLAVGHLAVVGLCHRHALRNLRGCDRVAYLAELAGMMLTLAAIGGGVWAAGLGFAPFAPLLVVVVGLNFRAVAEHLDRPAGRFRDTWQVVLPAPLSRWLLHADHHLEHHLRPDVRWADLPLIRAEIDRGGFIPDDQRLTPGPLVRTLLIGPSPAGSNSVPMLTEAEATIAGSAPRWAGRSAIRARRPHPSHPSRDSVVRLASE